MEKLFCLTAQDVDVAADCRILKAGQYLAYLDAAGLIQNARQTACAIEAEMRQAYEANKQKGYCDGVAEAKAQMAAALTDTMARTSAYLDSLEDLIVTKIIKTMKIVLTHCEVSDATLRNLVGQALDTVRSEKNEYLRIRVHPDKVSLAEQSVADLRDDLPLAEHIEVAADPGMDAAACMLETPVGYVDVSLEVQLRMIENLLRSQFRENKKI